MQNSVNSCYSCQIIAEGQDGEGEGGSGGRGGLGGGGGVRILCLRDALRSKHFNSHSSLFGDVHLKTALLLSLFVDP